MFRTPSSPNEKRQPPFIISIEHQDKSRNGHWRPAAAVQITSALRTGGFLHAIAPEELKSLLWLFSFLTPNGDCVPCLAQLASAMQVSESKARLRMERLAGWKWQGQAIVLATQRGDSGEAYAVAPGFVPLYEEAPTRPTNEQVLIRAAQREAVIAHSRARYARPRAEVEAQIARDNGWEHKMPVPQSESVNRVASTEAVVDEPQRELIELLQQQGLNDEQAIDLVSRFDDVRIRRQVQWLPLRRARNPVGLLIAAIEDDYAAPPVLWQRSALSPEVATEDAAPNDHSESASLSGTDRNIIEPNQVIELPLPPSR